MADIRSGGAFVEITARDNTRGGLSAVRRNLSGLAKDARVAGRDLRSGLALGFSGIATGDVGKLRSAGGLLARGLTGGFSAGLKSLKGLVSSGINAAVPAVKQGAVLLAVAAAAGVAAIRSSFSRIDDAAKVAAQVGIATEALIGLRHGAELSGVSVQGLDKALLKMQQNLSQDAIGAAARKSFGTLGLSIERVRQLKPEDAFVEIADAIAALENPAEKTAVAMDIFGRQGAALIPLFNQGGAAIRGYAKEAEALGITFSSVDAANVEAANDAMNRMGKALQGIVNRVAIALAPSIEAASKAMTEFFASGQKGANSFAKSFGVIVQSVLIFQSAFVGSQAVVSGVIGGVLKALDVLAKAVVSVLNTIPGVTAKASEEFTFFADALLENAGKLSNRSQKLLKKALDFELPKPKVDVSVTQTGAQKTATELLAAAKAVEELDRVLKDASDGIGAVDLSPLEKAASDAGKAYDDLIEKVKKAADAVEDAGKRREAAEQIALLESQKAVAVELARAKAVRESAQAEVLRNRATQDLIAQAESTIRDDLGGTDPIQKAVEDAQKRYQDLLNKLKDAEAQATEEIADAGDDAARESASVRRQLIRQEIAAVTAAQVQAVALARQASREATARANAEQAKALADARDSVAEAVSQVQAVTGGGPLKVQGGFDAQALSQQALFAFNDPTVSELKIANKKLEESKLALQRLERRASPFVFRK